jgi:hypothetical protein
MNIILICREISAKLSFTKTWIKLELILDR